MSLSVEVYNQTEQRWNTQMTIHPSQFGIITYFKDGAPNHFACQCSFDDQYSYIYNIITDLRDPKTLRRKTHEGNFEDLEIAYTIPKGMSQSLKLNRVPHGPVLLHRFTHY